MGTQADNGTSTAHSALSAWQTQGSAYLRGLADPAFFALWTTVRNDLALTPAGKGRRAEIKRLYDAVCVEFRHRMAGRLADSG